jgi:hypothetical protein
LCDEHGDVATASLIENWIDEAETARVVPLRDDAPDRGLIKGIVLRAMSAKRKLSSLSSPFKWLSYSHISTDASHE